MSDRIESDRQDRRPDVDGAQTKRAGTTAIDRLLESPGEMVAEILDVSNPKRSLRFAVVVAILGFAAYGAVVGSFQGGSQLLRAAIKAPLIAALSIALCLPSLYVFVGLSSGHTSIRRVVATAVTYSALLAAVLVGLMPISWLFSNVSTHLWFVGSLHLLAWSLALLLGQRALRSATNGHAPTLSLFVWTVLLFFVSLQMSTQLRPVLWHPEDAPFIENGRKFFGSHFLDVAKTEISPDSTPETGSR